MRYREECDVSLRQPTRLPLTEWCERCLHGPQMHRHGRCRVAAGCECAQSVKTCVSCGGWCTTYSSGQCRECYRNPELRTWRRLRRWELTLTLKEHPGLIAWQARRAAQLAAQEAERLAARRRRAFSRDLRHMESAVIRERPALALENYPFTAEDPLTAWVNQVLPKGLPESVRQDAGQDLVLALLERGVTTLSREDVDAHIRRSWRRYQGRDLSLDAPLAGFDDRTSGVDRLVGVGGDHWG